MPRVMNNCAPDCPGCTVSRPMDARPVPVLTPTIPPLKKAVLPPVPGMLARWVKFVALLGLLFGVALSPAYWARPKPPVTATDLRVYNEGTVRFRDARTVDWPTCDGTEIYCGNGPCMLSFSKAPR